MPKQNLFFTFLKGLGTSWTGMSLTFRHLLKARFQRKNQNIQSGSYFKEASGIVTLSYPYEAIPVPDNGRYQLHNEIEDCIVCDKCVKVCPVDCIDIEPIKSVGEFGKTSDGTPKRIYAAKFDIDMAKCCFCGLCTTVCPTECLTMTPEYDFATFDLTTMNFGFGNLTEAEAETKRKEWEVHQAEKQASKEAANTEATPSSGPKPNTPAGFRPRMPGPKRPSPNQAEDIPKTVESESSVSTKPADESPEPGLEKPKPLRMRPMIKPSDPSTPDNA